MRKSLPVELGQCPSQQDAKVQNQPNINAGLSVDGETHWTTTRRDSKLSAEMSTTAEVLQLTKSVDDGSDRPTQSDEVNS